jgi:hypothetical protein
VTAAAALQAWLESPEARNVEAALRRAGIASADALHLLDAVTEEPSSTVAIRELHERCGIENPLERWLLVRRGLDGVAALEQAAIPEQCRALTAAEIGALAGSDINDQLLRVSKPRFREFAKIVTGRRYAAGLFHFEVDGIPRRWLLRVRPADLPRVWWFVATRMGGRAPVVVPHMTGRRPLLPITEKEVNCSYHLMAQVLQLQPALKGLAGASWLRSPDTHRISPHLACVNQPIVEHGGLETTLGPAPTDCGVLARSETRRRLVEQGLFTPLIGMTLWPRDAMLAWCAAQSQAAATVA